MARFGCVLGMVTAVLFAGCSTGSAKRTTYETLQNIRQQECLKTPSADCEKREYYDDYERKRKALDPD